MKCEDIKKVILTDYVDGELRGRKIKLVEKHLSECAECRKLLDELKRSAVDPLRKNEYLKPPETVWAGIKEQLEEEPRVVPVFGRKPVLAMASAVRLLPGRVFRIRPGQRHRFQALDDTWLLEFSTHDDPADSIRIERGDVLPGEQESRAEPCE